MHSGDCFVTSDAVESCRKSLIEAERCEAEARFKMLCKEANIPSNAIAFIGGGKMAQALITRFVSSGAVQQNSIAISVKTEASAIRWKERGFEHVFTDSNELLRLHGKGIVFLAIKPQDRIEVFRVLKHNALAEAQLVISIMAGVSFEICRINVVSKGYHHNIVRFMPNTSAMIGAGASVLCASDGISTAEVEIVKFLAEKLGTYEFVNEKKFNAASAISGCGTAFVYKVISAIADGGVLNGLDHPTALKLAAQVVMGAGKMVLDLHQSPDTLKNEVCSPGGTTIHGIRELELRGVTAAFIEAVSASTRRAEEM